MGFINDSFMLKTKTAQDLYENYSKDMPIIDYHCHLNPQMIAENKKFKNILTLIDRADILTDTSIPNRCRQMLEWVKDSNIFESELKGLSLNDFSRYMGNAINLPEYVKRSLHACVSTSNQGSHFTDTTKMISGGDAPYLTKSLIYDLLNILDWCASQNGNIFIPKYKTDKTNKHDWKQFEN